MVTKSGPGKSYRKGITLLEICERFSTVEKAEAWFIEQRWPNGIACPFCGSLNIANIASRKPNLPVSGERVPQAFQRQDQDGTA